MTTAYRKQGSANRAMTPGELDSKTGGVYLSPGSRGGSTEYIPAFKGSQRVNNMDAYHSEAATLQDADLDHRLGAGSKVFGNPMFDDGPGGDSPPHTQAFVKTNSFFRTGAESSPQSAVSAARSQNQPRSGGTPMEGVGRHSGRRAAPTAGNQTMIRAFDDEEEEEKVEAPTPVVARPRVNLAASIATRDKSAHEWEAELKQMINSHHREDAVYRTGPTGILIKCYVKRVKNFFGTHCSFQMHLENGDIFLLAARRRKKSKVSSYVISQDLEDLKRDTDNCLAKLKANFTGTEYMLWGKSDDPHVRKGYAHEQLCINFKQSVLQSTGGPRNMNLVLPVPGSKWKPGDNGDKDSLTNCLELARNKSLPGELEKHLSMLTTKSPDFDENSKSYTLDFKGRVKEASVKNFQMVHWDHNTDRAGSEVALQFGKIEDDLYALDFMYPFNVEVAFAIALASIDTKLCYTI